MGDDFKIMTSDGTPIYFVDGEAFCWGSNLSFQDLNGNELAHISQKLLSWSPKYEIYKDGSLFAEVVKEFSWFNKNFTLDVPGPNDYTIEGSFWSHEYKFIRSERCVAKVSKSAWTFNHSYGVEIENGEDDISILCTAIVIDQVLYDENKK